MPPLAQPKQISEIKDFLLTARRKDAKCTPLAPLASLHGSFSGDEPPRQTGGATEPTAAASDGRSTP